MVTHNPLHRSGRAALPHPAPTLGDDAKAHEGIGMADARGRKPADDVTSHPMPRHAVPADCGGAGPATTVSPRPCGRRGARGRSSARRSTGSGPPRPRAGTRLAPGWDDAGAAAARSFTVRSLACHRMRIVCRSTVKRPVPRLRAAMREAEKVEGLGLPVAPRSPIAFGTAAELDEARLGGMQLQARTARTAHAIRARNRSASWRCSNPTTKSSAKRTTTTSPRACFVLHRWTQRSNT